jgi:hypothetical protein
VGISDCSVDVKFEALAEAYFTKPFDSAPLESSEDCFPCWIQEFALGHDFHNNDGH